jgi:DNA gyrase/topoisomerase IV subunit A
MSAMSGPDAANRHKERQVMRLPFEPFRTPSTKAGRKFCRLAKSDQVAYVDLVRDAETMMMASKKARILHFRIDEVPVLGGAGKGVRGLKLEAGDELLGVAQFSRPSDALAREKRKRQRPEFRSDQVSGDIPRRAWCEDKLPHWLRGIGSA